MTTIPEEFPSISGYKIERKLGEGGMAQVYLALQEGFERHVAIKVLSSHLVKDEDFKIRFVREARTSAKMSHQSIVPIYDYGVCGDFHYMAMEYLPGGDLKQKMLKGIPLKEAIEITKSIAKGLDYAGKKDLVHRDIKPENILFREDNSPVIADFGIARQISSKTNITMIGSIIGTPCYMSPEQAQGNELDHRADLYALGTIFYELLTGQAPFIGDSAISVSIKHITEMPPRLPPELLTFQPIVDRAMEKSPDQRFQTGNDFVAALTISESALTASSGDTVIMNVTDTVIIPRGTNSNTANLQPRNQLPTSVPPFYKKNWVLGLGFVFVQAVFVGGWFIAQPDKQNDPTLTDQSMITSSYNADPSVNKKSDELLQKAKKAIQSAQYFEPPSENAQYFLTTLLALSPQHTEGQKEITKVYEYYLKIAQEAMRLSELKRAEQYLNQASQISYYITEQAAKDKFNVQYQNMVKRRQQSLFADQAAEKIKQLIDLAEQALSNDRLTSPSGDNAYEYFQQVLVEAPQSTAALEGITKTATALLNKAEVNATQQQFAIANAFVAAAAQIAPNHPNIPITQSLIQKENETHQLKLLQEQNIQQSAYIEAKEKHEAKLKKRREQIKVRLKQANQYIINSQLIEPVNANALSLFEKVLAQDSTNIEALKGREQIGKLLVQEANSLAQNAQFEQARTQLQLANNLLTSKTVSIIAERSINQLEQAYKLNNILAKAERALTQNKLVKPKGKSALDYYQKALNIDQENIQALQGIESIGLKYIELARRAISNSNLTKAREFIEAAKSYTTSEIEIKTAEILLEKAISSETIALQKKRTKDTAEKNRKAKFNTLRDNKLKKENQQLIQAHLTNIDEIQNKKHTIKTNSLIAKQYLAILNIEPSNTLVKQKLKQLTEQEVILAKKAIDTLQIEKAKKHLLTIHIASPDYKTSTLTTSLHAANKKQRAISGYITTAEKIITEPYIKPGWLENNNKIRKKLRNAYQQLNEAKSLNKNEPLAHELLEALDKKYADIVTQLLKDGDIDEANEFLNDTNLFEWQSAHLSTVKTTLENETVNLKAAPEEEVRSYGGF